MKKCPYCAEEIKDEAVKCRYCGEWITDSTKPIIKPEGNMKAFTVEKPLPMKWCNFVTYIMCPWGIFVFLLLFVVSLSEKVEDFITYSFLIEALLVGILMYGLYNKTTWSWKLLLGIYIFNSLFGRIEFFEVFGPLPYLIFVLFVNLITTYPNYIYFKKRKHLFVN